MADVVPHGKQICPSMILHVPFVVLLFGAVLPSRDANDRRQDNAKKNYIVGFESTGILPSDVELLVGGVDKAHLRQLDNEGSVHLMALTEEQSQKLSESPAVSYVEEDREVFAATTIGSSSDEPPHHHAPQSCLEYEEDELEYGPFQGVPWHLDRLDQSHLPLDNQYEPVLTGKGVDVYILDTGISYEHAEFEGRARYVGYDPMDQVGGTTVEPMHGKDCHGHGTHIASLIGGATFGVAKEADLYSVRTLHCNNSALWSAVIDSLKWTAEHIEETGRPSVVSLSFIGRYSEALNSLLEDVVQRRGIPVVVAAGNVGGADACEFSPASSPDVITVAASNKEDEIFSEHPGSAAGPCVDVVAPGVDIHGADYCCPTCHTPLTGTSQSAPLVAGVVALHLQGDPTLTPHQLKEKVIQQASEGTIRLSGLAAELSSTTTTKLVQVPGALDTHR